MTPTIASAWPTCRRGGLNGEVNVDDFRMYGSARRFIISISIISRPIEGRWQSLLSEPSRDSVDVRSPCDFGNQRRGTGIYDIRGGGPSASCPLRRPLFLGASIRYPLEGYREVRHRRRAGVALRQEADPSQDAGDDRRHEFWRPLGRRQGSARTRRLRGRHQHHHRRRRHDGGRARPFLVAGLSIPAVALRHESRRFAARRRHRDRDRARRQARRRRHAAGPENIRAGGEDADPSGRH